ncbi:MAG: hypothetical protein ABFS16_04225 [Bacteroidota bacterium]
MYFLNGDRIYIKPENASASLNKQVESCLLQLKRINSGKRIFKLNYFVDTSSEKNYLKLQDDVRNKIRILIPEDIIQGFIAQPPLTCKIIVEAFYYDPSIWQKTIVSGEDKSAVLFSSGETDILVGSVQANSSSECKRDSENAFKGLTNVFNQVNFSLNSIVRQWNYIENILGFDGDMQRYQEFNNVRSEVYGDSFEESGYPAATGIGMNRGGVIIEFVAVKSTEIITSPVDNPSQISAHTYSKNVLVGEECILKTTPKFERARYFGLFDKKLIFISGTASITGERTIGVGNPVEQTKTTIQNIQRLYSPEVIQNLSEDKLRPKYGHARVYVKNRKDFKVIKKTFELYYGNLPVVYIIADVCRNDLLVEIEGKVILE